ncbi:hypothetical protein [Streptomyces flavofungini]|uniref:hypothetical protein n=1 Tax=Streptomyces flavofungini TaxID=68200 RepID=UPI0025B1F172|nr:hypothetical protein [Streptomyces flavofungini]WJV49933.1 hypothetical protein QUY26_33065 [Streptomyces flavofungini]
MSATDELLLETLRSVVKESPDRQYAKPDHMPEAETYSCFYVHTDEAGERVSPGCLVGSVLHRIGIGLDDLAYYEGESAGRALKGLFDEVSPITLDTFCEVQSLQDGGMPWGEAYQQTTGETI